MTTKSDIPIDEMRKLNLRIFKNILFQIIDSAANMPESVLEISPRGTGTTFSRPKKALQLDVQIQHTYVRELRNSVRKLRKYSDICVVGEEDFERENPDFTDKSGIFALVDMLDGSDLLERGLSNWCSAGCFFKPTAKKGEKILASFIGMPSGEIFYSTIENEKVYIQSYKNEIEELPNLSQIEVRYFRTKLEDSSICFYGQKVSSLRKTINTTPDLWNRIAELEEQRNKAIKKKADNGEEFTSADTKIDFRVYTLNGIPMVVKLVDYRIKVNRKIDVVFNVTGQLPHDAVPGLYLAIKLGAIVINLINRQPMKLEDLEESLMRPKVNKLYYLVASNEKLADEVLKLLPEIISQG